MNDELRKIGDVLDVIRGFQTIPTDITDEYPEIVKIFTNKLVDILTDGVSRAKKAEVILDEDLVKHIALNPSTMADLSEHYDRDPSGIRPRLKKLMICKLITRSGFGGTQNPYIYHTP